MKRYVKHKDCPVSSQVTQDAADPINKMQQQLVSLEKKIDVLIGQLSGRGPEVKHFSRPFQGAEGSHRQGEVRQGINPPAWKSPGFSPGMNGFAFRGGREPRTLVRGSSTYRDRVLHKAVCADCHKECEVPFKPSQDRPVYCKECFSKRKISAGPFKERYDNASREGAPRERRFDKGPAAHGADRKFAPRGRRFDKNRPGEDRKFFKKKKPGARRRKKGD